MISPDSFAAEPYAEVIRDFWNNARLHGIGSIFIRDYGYLAIPQRLLAWMVYLIAPDPIHFSILSVIASYIALAALSLILLLPPFHLLIPSPWLRLILGLALPLSIDYESRLLFNWPHIAFLPLLASALLLHKIKQPISYGAIWLLIPFSLAKPFSIALLPLYFLGRKHLPAKLLIFCTLVQIGTLLMYQKEGPPNPIPLITAFETFLSGIQATPFSLKWAGLIFFPLLIVLPLSQIFALSLVFLIHLLFLASSFGTTIEIPLPMYRHMIPVWSILHTMIALAIQRIKDNKPKASLILILFWALLILRMTRPEHWILKNHGFPMSGTLWFKTASYMSISPLECIPINPWGWFSNKHCYTQPPINTLKPSLALRHITAMTPFFQKIPEGRPVGLYLLAESKDIPFQTVTYRVEIHYQNLSRHLILNSNPAIFDSREYHLLWIPLKSNDTSLIIKPSRSIELSTSEVWIFASAL